MLLRFAQDSAGRFAPPEPRISVHVVSAEGMTPLPGSPDEPAHAEPRFGQTERFHLFRGDEPLVVVLTTVAHATGFPPGHPTREV